MSAQPLDELFARHAGAWTEQEWAVLPESMGRVELLDGALIDRNSAELDATGYSLAADRFVVPARAAEGRLTLKKQFDADLDLAALATAIRYTGL
ncbi:MAG: hypothetical protein JO296_10020 [Pseudonocardiales bacterium]|nr:hypothetical protein [Pseudonocardiales bacterium]MBV9650462.1 hypothetical protein [Pseudonocardiales bacterium]